VAAAAAKYESMTLLLYCDSIPQEYCRFPATAFLRCHSGVKACIARTPIAAVAELQTPHQGSLQVESV
jgi:hypothetical protein